MLGARDATVKGPFVRASMLSAGTIPAVDAHVHTTLTDGRSSFESYARRARELGLEAIAFTEHTDDSSPWYDEYLELRARIREMAAPTKVYFGAEVKMADPNGALGLGAERISRLDFIVGVLHRYPDGNGGYLSFDDLSPKDALELDYVLSKALLANPVVDVWGHPAGVYAKYFGAYRESWLRELVALAVRQGKVVEINTNPRYRSVFPLIFEECLARDCLVSIGSDAHDVGELGDAVAFLERVRTGPR
jgi:putative hydrolase